MAQRNRIVVQRQNAGFALAPAEIAVLHVIADSYHHSQDANVNVRVFAQCPVSGLSTEVLDFVHAVLDVIRRLHLIHFELRLGPVQFCQQRLEQPVALCRRVCCDHGVWRGF